MTTLHFLFGCSQIVVIVLFLANKESSRMREIHYKRLRDNLSRQDSPSTGLNATNHERGSAAQEFEGGVK